MDSSDVLDTYWKLPADACHPDDVVLLQLGVYLISSLRFEAARKIIANHENLLSPPSAEFTIGRISRQISSARCWLKIFDTPKGLISSIALKSLPK